MKKIVYILLLLILPFIWCIPYIQGKLLTPSGFIFNGFPSFYLNDYLSYGSFIKQGMQNEFPFENKFTHTQQKKRYLLLAFYILGRINSILNLSIPLLFMFYTYISGFLFLLSLFLLVKLIFPQRYYTFAFLFIVLSSGFNWVIWTLRNILNENSLFYKFIRYKALYHFNITNTSVLGLCFNPLWSSGAAIFIFSLIFFMKSYKKFTFRHSILMVIFGILAYLFHTYTGLFYFLFYFTLFFIFIFKDIYSNSFEFKGFYKNIFILLFLLSAFILSISYWQGQDPTYKEVVSNIFKNEDVPFIVYWPLSYGLNFIFSLFGIIFLSKVKDMKKEIFLTFFILSAFLTQTPFLLGYKYQFLMTISLSILSVYGILFLKEKIKFINFLFSKPLLLLSFFMFISYSNILSLFQFNPPFYIDHSTYEVLKFLGKQEKGVVLSSLEIGMLVPMLSNHKVYVGHWFLTPDFEEKQKLVKRFFEEKTDYNFKERFLIDNNIKFILYTSYERKLGKIDEKLPIRLIYKYKTARLYTTTFLK